MVKRAHVVLAVILVPVVTSVGVDLALGPSDPGLVVVVGEPPQPLEFTLPALSPYKFQYDDARITMWDSESMDNVIPPDTVFNAPTPAADVDGDGDVDLGDFALFGQCFGGPNLPPAPGCPVDADVDNDGDVDLADFALFGQQFTGAGVRATVAVTVFVEGLTASTALADTTITLLTDPDEDMTFTVEATQPVTVVSLDLTPTSGPLGTELTVTLQPAISPIAFDATTTAQWDGIYNPVLGSDSSPFSVAYNASQVRESEASTAIIVAGDGMSTNGPDSTDFTSPGTLDGVLTLNLGVTIARQFVFTPTVVPAVWESITYQDSSVSMGPPVLAGEPAEIEFMALATDPDPTPEETVMLQSYWAHHAAVMRIEENPSTSASAPSSISVDLVTFDMMGMEIDRLQNVTLDRVLGDDGDPAHLIYQSDLTRPIVFVDVALDPLNYPNVLLLQFEAGGTAEIVPALP